MAPAMRSIVRSNPGEGQGKAVAASKYAQDRKASLRSTLLCALEWFFSPKIAP